MFNYSKMFGSNKQAPAMRKKSIAGLDELSRIFGGESLHKYSYLDQYGKSLYVFAAVNKIATKVADIDMKMYSIINKDGESEELLAHDALDLVNRFNPYQTRTEFLKTAWINKKLTGETFWWKVRNNRGEVIELWNLRPDYMTVVSDSETYIKYYEFDKSDGKKERFEPSEIIHFKDPDPKNAYRGMSPLKASATRVETEQYASLYQKNFFKNNARPDALLTTEESLDGEQREQMTEAWEERHQGGDNNSRLGILEGGMKYQQVSISQREMDYIESMKFTRDDILVAFGVPKALITTDDINYANAEAGLKMFLSETIKPEMSQLVEVLNEFLIAPDFGEQFFLDFTDPTPEDRETLRADHTAGYGKWLTVNEIRAEYNLDPIDGGDEIAQINPAGPTAFGAGPIGGQNQEEDEKKRLKALGQKILRQRPMFRKKLEMFSATGLMIEKLLKEEVPKAVLKAQKTKKTKGKVKTKDKAKKDVDQKDKEFRTLFPDEEIRKTYYDYVNKRLDDRSKEFQRTVSEEMLDQGKRVIKRLEEFDKSQKGIYSKMSHSDIANILDKDSENKLFAKVALPFLLDFAKQGGEDAAELTSETFNLTDSLSNAMEKRSIFFAGSVNDTTFKKLTQSLSEGINDGEGIGNLTKRVKTVYKEVPQWRAQLIARTETTNANNEGTLEQYRESEVVQGKEWIATKDERTRESHAALDGETVSVDAVFSNGLSFPQEPNCRCVIAPALFDEE